MAKADLIRVRCWRGPIMYWHYGIDLGDETIVHLATEDDKQTMSVQRTTVEAFANGHTLHVELVDDPLPDEVVIQSAIEAIGRKGYCLTSGNCEHFARELKCGNAQSTQVEQVVHSVIRTSFTSITSSIGKNVVAKTIATATGAKLLVAAGALVPTLASELARAATYSAAKRMQVSHRNAERTSRAAAYTASAIGGAVVGGPAGSVAAVTITVAADRVADTISAKLTR
jgi:hypothetical protein